MQKLKSIKLYFFFILDLFFLSFRNFYFKSNYYNKKLVTFIPDRIFYKPSTYLAASLTTSINDFYKLNNTESELLWKIDIKDKLKFENLHNFLWLSKLDRKNSKAVTKNIIESWIDNFFNYHPETWSMEITAVRIIAWTSNTDITLEDSDEKYKKKFFISLVKQSNFLSKNLSKLPDDAIKIACCVAVILSGMIFEENDSNYKIGIRELEKVVKNYFDENGFPKSRNIEDVFICLKYLILIREWLKEGQKSIPDFLNDIVARCGACYSFLSCRNKKFPLFNGATEVNYKNYDIFLKNLKYKFTNQDNSIGEFVKVKKKKLEFYIDCGNPPPNIYAKYYQAGCLSFELISNKNKIICNSGYGKYLSPKLAELSRSTAAHSTLYINDTSSSIFYKNNLTNKIHKESFVSKHRIINKKYTENDDFYFVSASHNGYEKKFGYIHTRSIKILKKNDTIYCSDDLKKTKKYSGQLNYFIRFHIYPGTKIVKTMSENSVLISLPNGEGWLLLSKTNNFHIEKNIFLGNKNKIINNECISICENIKKEVISVRWKIERVS